MDFLIFLISDSFQFALRNFWLTQLFLRTISSVNQGVGVVSNETKWFETNEHELSQGMELNSVQKTIQLKAEILDKHGICKLTRTLML